MDQRYSRTFVVGHEAELVARYGKIGRRLSLYARGEDDRRVEPESKAKSLSSETTLDKDTAELARLRPILWQLAETVARRMKKAGIAGKGVTLQLKTAAPLLVHEADGRAFRLIGIGAHDLVDTGQVVQGDLFGGSGSTEIKVEKALDAVREKFGDDAIVKGRGFGTKLERQGPSKVETGRCPFAAQFLRVLLHHQKGVRRDAIWTVRSPHMRACQWHLPSSGLGP